VAGASISGAESTALCRGLVDFAGKKKSRNSVKAMGGCGDGGSMTVKIKSTAETKN
jgi:hypothetical protein